MLRTALGLATLLGILVLACASSDSTPSTTSSSSGSGSPSCTCTGQTSGQSFEVACGGTQCVAGSTYTCPAAGQLVIGARCGDSDSGVASGEGCGFFTCTSEDDCSPVGGFCFSAGDGNDYCYPPPNDASACATDETSTSKTTPSGATTLCIPAACPSPNAYVP